LSERGSRSSNRLAADSEVLFAAISQKGKLEPLLLSWSSRGELDLFVSEQAVEEIERVLDIGTEQLRDVLFHNGVTVVLNKITKKDAKYAEFVSESKGLDISSRPAYVFAKIFLRDNPNGLFLTEDKALLAVKDRLYNRVVSVNDFIRGIM
jgi:hypothetical protein